MKKFLATAAVLSFAAAAMAQSASFTENDLSGVAAGPDAGALGNVQSYDLGMSTTSDWTVLDLTVNVVSPSVSIWHASDETTFLGNGNLDVPLLPNTGTNSKEFDTFLGGAPNGANGFFVNNSIANGSWTSDASEISGFAIDGVTKIPLSLFNTATSDIGSFLGARLSFDNGGNALSTDQIGDLAVTIAGVVKTADNSAGTAFSYDLYQVPEPTSLALLGLGGLVGLVRRR